MLAPSRFLTTVTVLATATVLAGCGAFDAADADHEGAGLDADAEADVDVEVVMDEMAYEPDRIEVPAGEEVTVRLVNAGNLRHDLVLPDGSGSSAVQPGEAAVVQIGPFESATAGWCSVPGHQGQGMVLQVEVVD